MENLHYIQMEVLRYLLFKNSASFTELNSKQYDSEVLSYHLKKLTQLGYVERNGRLYSITQKGLSYAAQIQIETNSLGERVKLSIISMIVDGDKLLVIKRKKAPLLNKICFIAGKVQIRESSALTAVRETKEESGLVVLDPQYIFAFRQIVYDKKGNFLLDNTFHVFKSTKYTGDIEETEESYPFWITKKDLEASTEKGFGVSELYSLLLNPPKSGYGEYVFEIDEL